MPFHCVVNKCRANYRNETPCTIFRFPQNKEVLDKWFAAIPRKELKVTKWSRITAAQLKLLQQLVPMRIA